LSGCNDLVIERRRESLREAVSLTRGVFLESADTLISESALNDLLYYSWEERRVFPEQDFWSITDTEFESMTQSLASSAKEQGNLSAHLEDTLMRAYDYLGNRLAAEQHATRVYDLTISKYKLGESFGAGSSQSATKSIAMVLAEVKSDLEKDALMYAASIMSQRPQVHHPKG
jgi:hypothetical protein